MKKNSNKKSMEELNMVTETEIKRSMMRVYKDGSRVCDGYLDNFYVLIEAEHKNADIGKEERFKRCSRDELLWKVWDEDVSDNTKKEINKLSGEEKYNAMCDAIDPERKLFKNIKWIALTFDTETFIFRNVMDCMDIEIKVFYAKEGVQHCARCYEPKSIDIRDYMYQLLDNTIENQIDPLLYLGKRDPGQIIAGIRTDFEMNETGMDIIDFDVAGIYTQDISVLGGGRHILFTLYVDPEEIELCWDCREKLVRDLGEDIHRKRCVSTNHWVRLISASVMENMPGLVGIKSNTGYVYFIELETSAGLGTFYFDTINDKELDIDELEKIVNKTYSDLKDKYSIDEVTDKITDIINDYDDDIVNCHWFYEDE